MESKDAPVRTVTTHNAKPQWPRFRRSPTRPCRGTQETLVVEPSLLQVIVVLRDACSSLSRLAGSVRSFRTPLLGVLERLEEVSRNSLVVSFSTMTIHPMFNSRCGRLRSADRISPITPV